MFDIKRFDLYRKIPRDLTQATISGACISILCIIFILVLATCELYQYCTPTIVSDLFVHNPHANNEKIPVHIKVSVPRLSCKYIGLDIQDEQGRHEVGFVKNTNKTPLAANGCLFAADFQINQVPGNFHLSTHASRDQPSQIDFSHIVHEVTFGSPDAGFSSVLAETSFNPLTRFSVLNRSVETSYEYVIKIVPSIYISNTGKKISYQYTYAYRDIFTFPRGGMFYTAVWFKYDISPITVRYREVRQPFYSFITTLCAIIGGTFTVAGIIDSMVYTASQIVKKFELGKLS